MRSGARSGAPQCSAEPLPLAAAARPRYIAAEPRGSMLRRQRTGRSRAHPRPAGLSLPHDASRLRRPRPAGPRRAGGPGTAGPGGASALHPASSPLRLPGIPLLPRGTQRTFRRLPDCHGATSAFCVSPCCFFYQYHDFFGYERVPTDLSHQLSADCYPSESQTRG